MLLTLLALSLSLDSCKDSGKAVVSTPDPGGIPATYSYRAYSSQGPLVVVGTLTLAKTDGSLLSGTWAFEAVSLGDKVGPQLGAGKLAGSIQGTTISINLNPGWADNNVILTGTFGQDRITGTWTWVTFAGPTAQGRFEAVENP